MSAGAQFEASGRLNRAGYGIAAMGFIPGAIAWLIAARVLDDLGSPWAVLVGVLGASPFLVWGLLTVSRVQRLSPVLVVDDEGIGLLRGGQRHTVRWDQLAGVGVERRIRHDNLPDGGKPLRHLVGWPAGGQGPLQLTATAERSFWREGAYRLVDLTWFAAPDDVTIAVKQRAGLKWRD